MKSFMKRHALLLYFGHRVAGDTEATDTVLSAGFQQAHLKWHWLFA